MKYIKYLFFIGFITIFSETKGQVKVSAKPTVVSEAAKARITALVRPKSNSIMLRWIPDSSIAWNKSNTYGYKITRKTIERNGVVLTTPTSIVIDIEGIKVNDSLKPKWLPYYKVDSTAYMTLYDATLEKPASNSILDEMFAFATISANSRFNAAVLAGLGYVDNSVLTNEKYEYKIESNVPIDTIEILPAIIIVATNDFANYPKPPKPNIKRESKQLLKMSWNADSLANYFGGYFVERKKFNETNFVRLNKSLLFKSTDLIDEIIFRDSVVNTNTKYIYRLVGRSYFDELIASDNIQFDYGQVLDVFPKIKSVDKQTTGYQIKWTLPKTASNLRPDTLISRYSIQVSKNDSSNFKTLIKTLTPSDSSVQISYSSVLSKIDTLSTYYFIVSAIGKGGDSTSSIPFIMLPLDKNPPAKPQNVAAVEENITISTGDLNRLFIKVSWNPNTESDLLGYKVYRTIGNETEKIEISNGIISSSIIFDTLSKRMDYPEIKYYVAAFDKRYNQSEFGIGIYKKPDKRGPIAPRIIGYTVDGLDVTLQFQLSPDTDVDKYYVWRKEVGATGSDIQITSFTPAEKKTNFKDVGLTNGKTYIYWIFAKDKSNNESCYNPSANPPECIQLVPVKIINTKRSPVTTFAANFDIENMLIQLDWAYNITEEVESFELFRGVSPNSNSSTSAESTSFSLWNTLSSSELTITDSQIKDSNLYTYGIKVAYRDGTVSPMTIISVTTPDRNACTSGKLRIVKNTIIQTGTPIVDRACYEILLEEGFETEIDVDYTAEIGNN